MSEELQHPESMLQTMPTDVLVAVLAKKINLNKLAKEQLESRGLDKDGKWVGFDHRIK